MFYNTVRPIICKALIDQTYACRKGYRIKLWDKLVFSQVKKALGGNLRIMYIINILDVLVVLHYLVIYKNFYLFV